MQELQTAETKAIQRSTECEGLKQELSNERKLSTKVQEELSCLRAENKDLISKTAHVRTLTCSVEELKSQCCKLQVCTERVLVYPSFALTGAGNVECGTTGN